MVADEAERMMRHTFAVFLCLLVDERALPATSPVPRDRLAVIESHQRVLDRLRQRFPLVAVELGDDPTVGPCLSGEPERGGR